MVKIYFPDIKIELTDRQFKLMKRLCTQLRLRVITGLEFQRRARRISKKLTPARAYRVCRAIAEGRYIRVIKWYKVLAVLTTRYVGGKKHRHLEARMLIDVPEFVYEEKYDEFKEFCRWVLERYMEIKGYTAYLEYAEVLYFGIEKIEEFEDRDDREVEVWLEVYDYDYDRYPFEDELVLPPRYWENWNEAKKVVEKSISEFALRGRTTSRSYRTESILGEYEEDLRRWLGEDDKRFGVRE